MVFLHAALLSAESIFIELLYTRLGLAPLTIAGNSILISGIALIALSSITEKGSAVSVFRSWKSLVPASVLFAIGVFTWYDSITSIGASKEGLLAGPLEVVVILILARLLLKERLGRLQTAGAIIALLGFFATVLSAGVIELVLTWGDAEAVISAVSFAVGIVLITKLTRKHSALQVSGASLLIAGVILSAVLWTSTPVITPIDWTALLAFSILPLTAAFTYVVGLARIGASMTSTIGSFSILLTVLFQLLVLMFGFQVILPENIPLAVVGGILGIFGIYLIHRKRN